MRRGLLGACMAGLLLLPVPAQGSAKAVVVFLPATGLGQALDAPLTGTLARAGGIGLLTAPGRGDPVAAARAVIPAGLTVEDPGLVPQRIQDARGPVVVLAIAPLSGPGSQDVAVMILARGTPEQVLYAHGPVRGLTSATTRRPGLVSTVDLGPTIGAAGGAGSAIRIEGRPPVDLVERYRALSPLRAPAGLGVLGLALLGLAVGTALLLRRSRAPMALRAAGGLGLFAVALPVALLPAAALPSPAAAPVAAVAVGGGALLAVAAWRLTALSPTAAVAMVAGAGMGVVIVDGVLGWPGMLMPLIGGSAFEGSRMYGLGNGYGGVLVAGAVLAASRLRPLPGVGLLIAVGLLAGLPGFGANLGVATTLFVAAGAWLTLRAMRGPSLPSVAAGLGLAAAGVGGILAIHRAADLPTHVTRVLEGAERSGIAEIVRVYVRRLALNLDGTAASPAAWLVLVALPAALILAWRRAGPFRPVLVADPAWRDAVVVLAAASIAGYLVNDTIGVAGMGFVYVAAALVYPSLAMRWT